MAAPSDIISAIALKIEQGEDDILPCELDQLRAIASMDEKLISCLNREYLADASSGNRLAIVRYRGMVQDMLGSEYYLSEVDGVKTKYRDYFSQNSVESNNGDLAFGQHLAERQPLVLVPLPFESDYLHKSFDNNIAKVNVVGEDDAVSEEPRGSKRPFENEESGVLQESNNDIDSSKDPAKNNLQPLANEKENDSCKIDDDFVSRNASQFKLQKNVPLLIDKSKQAHAAQCNDKNWWPIGCMGSDPTKCPVLAKMYYDEHEDEQQRLKLNEIVEVVGVLSMNPLDADFLNQQVSSWEDSDSNALPNIDERFKADEFCDLMVIPPPSLLPRLRVLSYTRCDLEDIAAPAAMQVLSDAMDLQNPSGDSLDDRSVVIKALSTYVFDENNAAAEALLMSLLSMSERENISEGTWGPVKTEESTLGCSSLNLIMPDANSSTKLHARLEKVLGEIVPIVGSIHVNRQSLNAGDLVAPARNEVGKLVPSPLQLPKGSTLVINQSTLTEGHVGPNGAESLLAVSTLTKSHWVPYRFEGMFQYNFEADYRVIVLSCASTESRTSAPGKQTVHSSNGSKLLPCTMRVQIPYKPDSQVAIMEVSNENDPILPTDLSMRIRSYLSRCRTVPREGYRGAVRNIGLPKDVLQAAEKDFIKRRIARRVEKLDEIGEEDFHRWLTITRLQARSRVGLEKGNAIQQASICDWKAALRLDDAMHLAGHN